MIQCRVSCLMVLVLISGACASNPPSIQVTAVPPAAVNASSIPSSSRSPDAPSLEPSIAQRWLAFSTGPAAKSSDIFVAKADGSQRRQVTNGPGFRYNPAWSPDGQRILYRVEGPEGAPVDPKRDGIWVVNADGSGDSSLSIASGIVGAGHAQPWSPDGTRIVMSGAHFGGALRIWVMNADGGQPRPLTPESIGEAQYPAWSPDGKHIAFSGVTSGIFRLYVMNADGSELRPLTGGPKDGWPIWSPDGRQIAFGRGEGLAIMNADGSNQRMLSDEMGVPATWAPGDLVAFNCPLGADAVGICALDADGKTILLLGGADAGFPSWKP
jgi:Tol biopolymer transport system component